MTGVDSRIVTMKFDNKQFEQGAHTTISTLGKLKSSLQLDGANKGLMDVQRAADNVRFGHIEGGITRVSAGFLALSTVAVTALATITQKAMSAGTQFIKSFTLKPIMDGFREYEIKMGSIQTILANTVKQGTKLEDVNAALDELNNYADKTIYSFSEMTKAVGLFTNAGISLEDATSMIKGFSNEAAASGATAEGTARAQYQLSQALTTGTIRLMDWKSLTNAGMGNKNMQDGVIAIADAMGEFEKAGITAKDAGDNFNASLEKEWFSADVAKVYFKTIAGELDAAQLKSMGLADDQVKMLLRQAKIAEESATKVRTFTKLLGTVAEAIGSSWSETFGIVIGNFDEATELFTNINNGITKIVEGSSKARNKVLQEWKDKGGRDTLIDALHNTIKAIGAIITPIKEAFRDIFPAKTSQDLVDLTNRFFEFTKHLKIGSDTAQNLKDTFKGVFSVMSLVWEVIKGVTGVIFDLVAAVFKGSGGFLDMTGALGRFLTGVVDTIKQGGALTGFFDILSKVLQAPIKLFAAIGTVVGDLFSGPNSKAEDIKRGMEAVAGRALGLTENLTPLEKIFKAVGDAIKGIAPNIQETATKFAPFITKVQETVTKIGQALKSAFDGEGFDKILKLINTGIFAGILMAFRKFADGIKLDFGQGGIMDSVSGAFDQLTGTLSAMQANIKADTLMKIAGAVALLTGSIVALALIDSDKLTKAMVAVTGAFAQLLVAMGIMTKITGMVGFVKIPVVATGLVILAGALLLMSAAVKNMSSLSWSEVAKGLTGIGGSLGILLAALKPMVSMQGRLMATGTAVFLLAASLNLMASAVEKFGNLDFKTLAQGMTSVAAALAGIAGVMHIMPLNMPMIALGLLGVSLSLNLIASAVKTMGQLDFGAMLTGLVGLAGGLGVIAGLMSKMPPNMALAAGSLILVGLALEKIAEALVKIGGLPIDQLVNGIASLIATLFTVIVAIKFAETAVMGAVALGIMAASISLLVPALIALGKIDLKELAIAMGALVATFIVLGGAAAILGSLSPVILALAASFALLGAGVFLVGAGFALAGAGILMFATGMGILVGLGGAVVVVIANILNAIVEYIPKAMKAFAEGTIEFAKTITENIPTLTNAMAKAINGLMDAIQENAPKIIRTMKDLLFKLLDAFVEASPRINRAGMKVLLDFLQGIADNIYQIITVSAKIITEFLRGIGDNAKPIADEGAKTVVKFINAIAEAIRNNAEDMDAAGRNLSSALLEGFMAGIFSGMRGILDVIRNLGSNVINTFKNILGIKSPSKVFKEFGKNIDEGLASGVSQYAYLAEASIEESGTSMISTMRGSISKLNELIADDINSNPIIAPVLDLSNVKSETQKLNGLLSDGSLNVTVATQQATSIANDRQLVSTGLATSNAKPTTIVNFEQNNYSPEKLSDVDIYRQTKNQLALFRETLK